MSKPKAIVLRPQFKDSHFMGYDQVAGTHYFDADGHLYGFVAIEDYNALQDRCDQYEEIYTLLLDVCKNLGGKNLVQVVHQAHAPGVQHAGILLSALKSFDETKEKP